MKGKEAIGACNEGFEHWWEITSLHIQKQAHQLKIPFSLSHHRDHGSHSRTILRTLKVTSNSLFYPI